MRRKNRLVLGLVTLTLGLGVVGGLAYASKGFQNWDVKTWVKQTEEVEPTKKEDDKKTEVNVGEFDSNIVCHGMRLMALKSGTNNDGTSYRTFGYTFDKENSTLTDVGYMINFADGTSCSEYVTCSVDSSTKTVTVNCLKAFPQTINLKLYLNDKLDVFSIVSIDYEKRLEDVTFNDFAYVYDYTDLPAEHFDIHKSFTPTFGIGSKNYSKELKLIATSKYTITCDMTGSDGVVGSDFYNFCKDLENLDIIGFYESNVYVYTFDNLVSLLSNKDKAILYSNYDRFENLILYFNIEADLSNTNYRGYVSIPFKPFLEMQENFNNLVVIPTSIIPETTSINF